MTYIELGQNLTALRKQQDITQAKLAELAGVSRATINAFEQGRASDLGLKKYIKLLSVLGYELNIAPSSALPTLDELQHDW